VVLLVNPLLITLPLFSEQWVSIKEDTDDMLNRLGISAQKIKFPVLSPQWLRVFSFNYFQESVRKLHYRHSAQAYAVDGDIHEGEQILFKDGRRLWSTKQNSITVKESRRMAMNGLDYERHSQLRYRMKLDKGLEDIFKTFILYLKDHHVQVTFCLLPYHPAHYASYLAAHQRGDPLDITGIEAYYRDLAKKLNIQIIGSYDPAFCGLEGADFYDGDHIRNDVIERMLKQKGSQCSIDGGV